MAKYNVLVFPAGAENALEIYDSLRYNVNVELYGASGKKDFAEFRYPDDRYIEEDLYFTRPGFIEKFNGIIEKYGIDVVIPTHDDIALYFAEHREEFKAKVLVSDKKTALICRKKSLMYKTLSGEDFCPEVYKSEKEVSDNAYPLFVKPDIGAGSVGAKVLKSKEDVFEECFTEKYVVCEYLPGEELTVDCFTDRKGNLKFVGPRSRDRILMGISFGAKTVKLSEEIKHIAETINSKMSLFGAWYFQIKEDKNGNYKLLEVSCRQAGTMTLYRHMGINFPMLGIFELMGVDTSFVKLDTDCRIERCLHTAFKTGIKYDTVYFDFDDTIIVKDKVCDVVIRFIYQCINEGKKLILLTRHEGELATIMREHRLNKDMFDEIIHITFNESKADYIKAEKAIFLDNSYVERKLVADKFGIPVFDVDMIDMLLAE